MGKCENKTSPGHDIEAAWLLREALEVLGDQELLQQTLPVCRRLAVAARDGIQMACQMGSPRILILGESGGRSCFVDLAERYRPSQSPCRTRGHRLCRHLPTVSCVRHLRCRIIAFFLLFSAKMVVIWQIYVILYAPKAVILHSNLKKEIL